MCSQTFDNVALYHTCLQAPQTFSTKRSAEIDYRQSIGCARSPRKCSCTQACSPPSHRNTQSGAHNTGLASYGRYHLSASAGQRALSLTTTEITRTHLLLCLQDNRQSYQIYPHLRHHHNWSALVGQLQERTQTLRLLCAHSCMQNSSSSSTQRVAANPLFSR